MFSQLTNTQGEKLDFAFHHGIKENTLVILGHGVTGNKDRPLLIAVADALAAAGWPCVRLSFSGNGDSEGNFVDATITKEVADLQAMLDQVPATTRVAYVGHSMGAAVGLLTAVREEKIHVLVSLAGMIETATFYQREFSDVTPGEGFMWDEEDCPLSQAYADDMLMHGTLLDAAAAVVVPWLLIHGSNDDVVPLHDSEAAYAVESACTKKLLLVENAGHSFDEASYPQVTSAIEQWLTDHLC